MRMLKRMIEQKQKEVRHLRHMLKAVVKTEAGRRIVQRQIRILEREIEALRGCGRARK